MKKTALGISLSIVFTGWQAWASSGLALPLSSVASVPGGSACATDSKDTFETPALFTQLSKKFSGQCINTERFRAVKILKEDEETITISNFHHNNRYWNASLPKSSKAYDKLIFQVMRFPVAANLAQAAHTQMRVKLKKGHVIYLSSQSGPQAYTTVSDFVYSVEAAFPKDVSYNFLEGMDENYSLVGRVVSLKQRLYEKKDNSFEQYPLAVSPDDVSNFAIRSLRRSSELGLRYFYNTIRPNCTTEVLDLVDSLPSQAPKKHRAFNVMLSPDPVAGPSVAALKERGLLEGRALDLAEEVLGRKTQASVNQAEALAGFIRPLPNLPFAFVTMVPGTVGTQAMTHKILKDIEKYVSQQLPKILQSSIAPVLLGGDYLTVTLSVIGKIHSEFQAYVNKINNQLPSSAVHINSFFIPWEASDTNQTSLQALGIPLDLPFREKKYERLNQAQANALLQRVYNNTRALQEKEIMKKGKVPAFLTGILFKLTLQKEKSRMTTQTLMSLTPTRLPFVTAKDQVDLDRFVIPRSSTVMRPTGEIVPYNGHVLKEPFKVMPSVLITHSQLLSDKIIKPTVNVDFGNLANFQSDIRSSEWGIFKIEKESNRMLSILDETFPRCQDSSRVVPEMIGIITSPRISGGVLPGQTDRDLRGNKIALGIYGLKISYKGLACLGPADYRNEEAQKICNSKSKSGVVVTEMDVRAKIFMTPDQKVRTTHEDITDRILRSVYGNKDAVLPGFRCFRNPLISNQVINEANWSIDEEIKKLREKHGGTIIDFLTTATGALKTQ